MFKKKENATKKDHLVIGKNPDLIEMTLLQFFKIMLVEKFLLKKQTNYTMNAGRLVEIQPPKTHNVAIILDGKVADVLVVNPKMADLLLANPKFEEVTDADHVHPGRTEYVEGKFVTAEPATDS